MKKLNLIGLVCAAALPVFAHASVGDTPATASMAINETLEPGKGKTISLAEINLGSQNIKSNCQVKVQFHVADPKTATRPYSLNATYSAFATGTIPLHVTFGNWGEMGDTLNVTTKNQDEKALLNQDEKAHFINDSLVPLLPEKNTVEINYPCSSYDSYSYQLAISNMSGGDYNLAPPVTVHVIGTAEVFNN